MDAKKRLYYIDCIKGFATILVVIGYVFDGYIRAGVFQNHRDFMCSGFNLIYSFHMALFFLISGFVYNKAYITDTGDAKPSLKKQILNILIIYLVYSILFGIFKMFLGKYTNSDVSLVDILMICVKPIYPYWYLYVLLFYYLPFRAKILYKCSPIIPLFILIVVAFFSNLIPDSIGYYFEIRHFLYYSLFFYLGITIAFYNDTYKKYELIIAVLTLAVSILIMSFDRVGYSFDDFSVGLLLCNRKWNFLIALGLSLILLYLFRLLFANEKHIRVKFMSFLGRYSLEIYVIHCVFTAGNRVVLAKLHIENFYLNIAINTVISILIPIVFAMVCQKANIHKMIFRPAHYITERRNKNEI